MSHLEQGVGVALTATESWALLRRSVVGRLAVIVDDRPDIFPVNHLVDHGSVVFRTAIGSKLAGAVGHWVAFEVDGYDLDTGTAWSVVVKGDAQVVNRLDDVLAVIELPLFPWHSSPKPHFVRIEPESITGRRFEVAGGARSDTAPSADSAIDPAVDSVADPAVDLPPGAAVASSVGPLNDPVIVGDISRAP